MANVNGIDKSSGIVEQTAQQLKKVSPDVVFLRGVSGWKMCSQLAEALKPADYRVLVCSAFPARSRAGATAGQVAVLARNAAYFTWSEPWNPEADAPLAGGYCFAAVQVAGHRFGFSCVDLPGTPKLSAAQAAKQWLETLAGYRGWSANRLEGFVSATFGLSSADSDTGQLFRAAAFADPLMGNGPPQVLKTHLVPSADEPAGLILSGWPATCDFDFSAAPVIVVGSSPPVSQPAATLSASNGSAVAWWIGGAVAFLILLTIVLMQVGIRRRLVRLQSQGALVPLGSGSYNVVVAGPVAPSRTPSVSPVHETLLPQSLLAHLAEWLKQTFVQKLLRDREHLRAVQQAATLKVLSVDERLARLEGKIQKETASYERQIEQLSRELLTAREENLELIRTQIKLLNSQMEAARARVLESESVQE
jgi:hypothetical protein